MSSVILIPPSANMVEEVRHRLVPKGADYSRNLVLFPGKRPGFFLRQTVGAEEGRSYIPPRILSMDEFVHELLRTTGSTLRRRLEGVDAVSLLHRIHCSMPDRIGGEHFLTLDAFLPLGLQMFNELEELMIAGCAPALVREAAGSVTFGGIYLLPILCEKFYALAAEEGYTTRALMYREAADRFTPQFAGTYDRVIVAGFFGLTDAERRMFIGLSGCENVSFLFHNGRGIRSVLQSLEFEAAEPEPSEVHPSITFVGSPDAHGQVFALSAKIGEAASRQGNLSEDTVIVLPDPETLFPVFHQTLALLRPDQYNISLGYTIERTPVYAFFNALLGVVESIHEGRVFIPDYLKFVLHPYTKNVRFGERAEATRILFHALENSFLQRRGQTYASLEEIEGRTEVFQAVAEDLSDGETQVTADEVAAHLRRIHDATIRTILGMTTIGDAAARSIDALNFIYDHSTARLHPFFHPFAQRMLETLDLLSGELIASHAFGDISSTLRFLRSTVRSAEVHFPGTPLHGLQVLGFLETRSLKFRRVFLLDANDDIMPGAGRQAMSLLPRGIRERLKLETQSDRERIYEYYTDVLISGAEEVCIYYTEDGRRDRSRYVERLLWERQQRDSAGGSLPSIDRYAGSSSYQLTLTAVEPPAIAKLPAAARWLRSFRYTATALDTYLVCQRKFYFTYVLGLRERDDVSGEIGQADVGTLVHAVLQEFFRPLVGTPLSPAHLDHVRLAAVLQAKIRERWGTMEFGNVVLMQEQIRRRIGELLDQWQKPLIDGNTIVISDVEGELEAPLRDIRFYARVDRIEERNEQWHILDFKTGGNVKPLRVRLDQLALDDRSTWGSAVGSFQLPLYALMLAKLRQQPVERMHPAFVVLGEKEVGPDSEIPLFASEDNTAENYRTLEDLLFRVIDEITDGAVPFAPPDDLNQSCPKCPFSPICGTQWVKGWEGY